MTRYIVCSRSADQQATASRGDPGLAAHFAGPAAGAADEVKIFKGITARR